jgi:hypothetical protein
MVTITKALITACFLASEPLDAAEEPGIPTFMREFGVRA